MESEKIEKELNELIKRCVEKRGYVWIIDKRGNKYSIRLEEEVKIRPFVPTVREDTDGVHQ